ncbi:hypothetical protein IF2G_08229 [Cordyceps javanica]|nr:hypothetical protein IF2G_08229 [Cordyceps javanica]
MQGKSAQRRCITCSQNARVSEKMNGFIPFSRPLCRSAHRDNGHHLTICLDTLKLTPVHAVMLVLENPLASQQDCDSLAVGGWLQTMPPKQPSCQAEARGYQQRGAHLILACLYACQLSLAWGLFSCEVFPCVVRLGTTPWYIVGPPSADGQITLSATFKTMTRSQVPGTEALKVRPCKFRHNDLHSSPSLQRLRQRDPGFYGKQGLERHGDQPPRGVRAKSSRR